MDDITEALAAFKFFRSYYDAAKLLGDEAAQGAFLMALAGYALYGIEPQISGPPGAMFLLAKPNIDASKRKAEAGRTGGNAKQTESKRQANFKQTVSNSQANRKQTPSDIGIRSKEEGDRSKEVGNTPLTPQGTGGFERFWAAYPKKVGKQAAKKAFDHVKTPVETLLTAIERQKCSAQWSKDNGQYIPNPATWLNQGRWDDELDIPAQKGTGTNAFAPGEQEKSAIAQLQRLRNQG